jgi:hypothetical protein
LIRQIHVERFLEEIGYDDIFTKNENFESNPNNQTMINLDNPEENDTSFRVIEYIEIL